MTVATVLMFRLYLSFLSHATREISLTVYILLKARGTRLGKYYLGLTMKMLLTGPFCAS